MNDDPGHDDDRSLLERIAGRTKARLDPDLFPEDLADAVMALVSGSSSPEPNELLSTLSASGGNRDAAPES